MSKKQQKESPLQKVVIIWNIIGVCALMSSLPAILNLTKDPAGFLFLLIPIHFIACGILMALKKGRAFIFGSSLGIGLVAVGAAIFFIVMAAGSAPGQATGVVYIVFPLILAAVFYLLTGYYFLKSPAAKAHFAK